MREQARRLHAGTVIAVVALVLFASGGAWAAGRYLITSTKQIKPSVLKQLRGAAGTKGATGAAGPQGPAGPAGVAGAAGSAGKEGKEGREGVGKEGKEGKTGSPWTAGGTLPSGKTETGTWAIQLPGEAKETVGFAPISIPIPLASGGTGVFLNAAETSGQAKTGGCEGTIEEPTAPPGKLCVYTEEEEAVKLLFAEVFSDETPGHFGRAGAFVEFDLEANGKVAARGTWAVTAP